ALTIMLGAFGAHALKEILSVEALNSFETAVRYQMYHVLLLLLVNLSPLFNSKFKNNFSYLIYAAILCFSGSIYAITIGGVNPKMVWFITPLGGLLLIVAWCLLALNFINIKSILKK
ncbi:MAG: DUF423 domain-containing protein, partial [Flavobacteriales bacterium CG_4_9_14_0_2_um_filter_35_242]